MTTQPGAGADSLGDETFSAKLLVNHVGFTPAAAKYVVMPDLPGARVFHLTKMRRQEMTPVFTDALVPAGGDLGRYRVGDFSAVREPGVYRLSAELDLPMTDDGVAPVWSHDLTIGNHALDEVLRSMARYFDLQSCGASAAGYHTPCHTGPIRRTDGGPARPLQGGWHSAADHPRDLAEILHGAFGLLALAQARPDLEDELALFNKVRWGNDYFLALQDPAGYVYFGVYPLDYWGAFDWWESNAYVLRTEPAALYCQYNFAAIQALIATYYQERDPAYAARCRDAAARCLAFWRSRQETQLAESFEVGAGALASALMARATGESQYEDDARAQANLLCDRLASAGSWTAWAEAHVPSTPAFEAVYGHVLYAAEAPLGLGAVARFLPKDRDRARWLEALERYGVDYCAHFATANAFGIMPYSLYNDPAGRHRRRWGALGYRCTIDPGTRLACPGSERTIQWQAGNIATVAGYGVALALIGDTLGRPSLAAAAQRQLDWVLGANPFDASFVLGVGHNHPTTYPALDFEPTIPDLPGATMEGAVGDEADRLLLLPGYYGNVEFWMPHHAWTLWLAALMARNDQDVL
jgi:hypothetical protein